MRLITLVLLSFSHYCQQNIKKFNIIFVHFTSHKNWSHHSNINVLLKDYYVGSSFFPYKFCVPNKVITIWCVNLTIKTLFFLENRTRVPFRINFNSKNNVPKNRIPCTLLKQTITLSDEGKTSIETYEII